MVLLDLLDFCYRNASSPWRRIKKTTLRRVAFVPQVLVLFFSSTNWFAIQREFFPSLKHKGENVNNGNNNGRVRWLLHDFFRGLCLWNVPIIQRIRYMSMGERKMGKK
jgi:hypothetical protein